MAIYRTVACRIWGDKKFQELSAPPPNGQTLFFYLLTGPHTGIVPGLSHVGEASLAEGLGWPLEAFRKAFAEASSRGMVLTDWKARLLWLPNAVKYNPPQSPNVCVGWGRAMVEIPECELREAAISAIKTYLLGKGEAFAASFERGLKEGFGESHQDQEQEQDQEQDKDKEQEYLRARRGGAGGGRNGKPSLRERYRNAKQRISR